MREFWRAALCHLLVPACVAVLWTHAHLRGAEAGKLTGTWREAGTLRTGNPYTASVPPITWRDPDDAAPTEIADAAAPGDPAHE